MSGRKWTPEERETALALPFEQFSGLYPDRTFDAWRLVRQRSGRSTVDQAPPVDRAAVEAAARESLDEAAREAFEAAVAERRERLIADQVARETRAALDDVARWREFTSILEANIARLPAYRPPQRNRLVGGVHRTPEAMVALVSDVHVGKLVRPDFVGEGFAYDLGVFSERLERWKSAILQIKQIQERAVPINRLVLPFLGDLVDGVDMRRGHGLRVAVNSAVQQALIVARSFSEVIADLGTEFEQVDVLWLPGNHGRVGEYGVGLSYDNWDFVAGTILDTMLANAPNVRVRVRTQKYDLVRLGPLTTYFAHGDDAAGGGSGGFAGLPVYGLARSNAKDIGLHRQVIDLYAIGHFHNPNLVTQGSTTILVNGAWDGGDDFSVNKLKAASTPTQWTFGVHPRRGMTFLYPVTLVESARPPSPVFDFDAELEAAG